jgi:hypothetical protein
MDDRDAEIERLKADNDALAKVVHAAERVDDLCDAEPSYEGVVAHNNLERALSLLPEHLKNMKK